MIFKSDFPFAPKKWPFFYGWFLVFAAMLGIFSSIPGQTAGFSAFTNPLIESLKITRSDLALAYGIGTICSGFILPKGGVFLDKYGTRLTAVIVYGGLGTVLYIFSCSEAIFASISTNGIAQVGAMAVLVLGLRFFGQGMLPVISNTMVSRWFDKKRGKVIAFMGVVNSLTFNAAPAVLSFLIVSYTWQLTWRYLAVIMGIGFLLFAWLFFRDSPESCDLQVDGEKSEVDEVKEMEGMTVEEAVKTRNFIVLALALSIYGMTLTGLTFHLQAIGQENGLQTKDAMKLFIPVSIISIPIGFMTAWLSDKFSKKILIIILLFAQIIAYISVSFLGTKTGYYCSIVFLGLSGGMFGPIYTIAFPWFFGRKHLGAINGKVTSIMVIMSGIGPFMFSIVKSFSGSFSYALYLSAVFPFLVLFIAFKITPGKLYN